MSILWRNIKESSFAVCAQCTNMVRQLDERNKIAANWPRSRRRNAAAIRGSGGLPTAGKLDWHRGVFRRGVNLALLAT